MNGWRRSRFALPAAGRLAAVLVLLAVASCGPGSEPAARTSGDCRKDWQEATPDQRIPLANRMVAEKVLIGLSRPECLSLFGDPARVVWYGGAARVTRIGAWFAGSFDDAGKLWYSSSWWSDAQTDHPAQAAREPLEVMAASAPEMLRNLPDWVIAWRTASPAERVAIAQRMAHEDTLKGHSVAECMALFGNPVEAEWRFAHPTQGPFFELIIYFDGKGCVREALFHQMHVM